MYLCGFGRLFARKVVGRSSLSYYLRSQSLKFGIARMVDYLKGRVYADTWALRVRTIGTFNLRRTPPER